MSTRKRELNLIGLFGNDSLEGLEKTLADSTEFSYSIIDYKGRQVVKSYYQEAYKSFLKSVGEDDSCQMHAAFAAAKAAFSNSPYIYQCQCGLVKIAIPIIVNDQYMGAIIGGYVRCKDVDALDPSEDCAIVQKDFPQTDDHLSNQAYQRIPSFTAGKIQAVSKLIAYVLREMCQKENYVQMINNEEHNQTHVRDLRSKNQELKKQLKEMEDVVSKSNLFPQTLLNMLVTISSVAIMEEAEMTQDIIAKLSSVLRYYIEYHKKYLSLEQELTQVKNYLDIMKVRYEDRVSIDCNWKDDVNEQMIPKLILLPFMEYMVNFGILNQSFQGTIRVNAGFMMDRCIITFSLEDQEDSLDKMVYLKESGAIINERIINEQLLKLEKRMESEYGDDYKLIIEPKKIELDIPKSYA